MIESRPFQSLYSGKGRRDNKDPNQTIERKRFK